MVIYLIFAQEEENRNNAAQNKWGCAMIWAVSCHCFTMQTEVQSQICGGECGTRRHFPPSTSLVRSQYHSRNAPFSFIHSLFYSLCCIQMALLNNRLNHIVTILLMFWILCWYHDRHVQKCSLTNPFLAWPPNIHLSFGTINLFGPATVCSSPSLLWSK